MAYKNERVFNSLVMFGDSQSSVLTSEQLKSMKNDRDRSGLSYQKLPKLGVALSTARR